MDLTGTISVVTGAGAGLGRLLALGLAEAGSDVLVADRDAGAAEETARQVLATGRSGWPVVLDVRDDDALAGLVDRAAALGGPHVVVNNAGGWSPGAQFPTAPPRDWSATIDLNLRAPMLLTQLALPTLVAAGGGAVVNVGSSGGAGSASYGSPEYAAAKAGLVRFTTSVAGLEESHGVRVTAVVPGWIGLERAVAEVAAMDLADRAETAALIPPEEVVGAVLELARSGSGGTVVELRSP